jgi:predicted alpha/beta-fold hydrolase
MPLPTHSTTATVRRSSPPPPDVVVRGFRPAWWVPGRHWHTLWSRLFRRLPQVPTKRLQWTAPDGENLEVHRVEAPAGAPRILVLHGLEGSWRSHYAAGLLDLARAKGWGVDLLHFRGCGDEPNIARRFYHSGETTDLQFVLGRIADEYPDVPIGLVGYSLGGNVLLKYLGESGNTVPRNALAAVAVSVPFDLEAGSRYISMGTSRIYDRHFLSSLRRKAVAKLDRYPDLFDRHVLERARTIFDFDNAVTAPVHGFDDASDYYTRSSSRHFLEGIRVPTLLLSSYDDPFLPAEILRGVEETARENPWLQTEFTSRGGHVGFVDGVLPWRPRYYAEWRVIDYLSRAFAIR